MLIFKLPFHVAFQLSPGERNGCLKFCTGLTAACAGCACRSGHVWRGCEGSWARGPGGVAGGGERLKGRKRESPSYAFPQAPAAGGSNPARGWQRRGRHREGGGCPLRPSLPACLPACPRRAKEGGCRPRMLGRGQGGRRGRRGQGSCPSAPRAAERRSGTAARGAVLQHRGAGSAPPVPRTGELSFSTAGRRRRGGAVQRLAAALMQ